MTANEIITRVRDLGLDEIAYVISQRHAITLGEMFGRGRNHPLPAARAEFYAHLKFVRGWSYPKIGQLVGRDHTTIMDQVRAAQVRETSGDFVARARHVRVAS